VAVDKVKPGETRNTVISVLGVPKSTESKKDSRTDIFEFTDGYSAGSKTRVILYIAGDVFTLGLSELLFWPIELVAGDGIQGRAIVSYGMDDIAKSVLLTKADGSPWAYDQAAPPAQSEQPVQLKNSTNTSSKATPVMGAVVQN